MSLSQVEKRITIRGGSRMSLSQQERTVSLSEEESVPFPIGEERVPIPRREEVA